MASRETQRTRIADELLKAIRQQTIPVGTKLPSERQLATEYGVSRPIVREALGMLSMLDVIDIQMGRGAFVVSADVSTDAATDYGLLDIVDAREAIEMGAVRLAVSRSQQEDRDAIDAALARLAEAVESRRETADLDMDLHRSIVEAARSPKLMQLWGNMTEEIAHTIRVSPHGRSMSPEIFHDHEALALGVVRGDVQAASAACSSLYDSHRDFLRSLLGG